MGNAPLTVTLGGAVRYTLLTARGFEVTS